eukprot:TRINITY_DN14090_c0_g1_i1.p1 TRINITY_DN14090_c0_g1~~TRINITY_DN14090_c0_g1_i1.p1  ORF type:complete len:424 (-),score=122.16 TRINITY_DN14090_c0_g1_i1:99-1370(-)
MSESDDDTAAKLTPAQVLGSVAKFLEKKDAGGVELGLAHAKSLKLDFNRYVVLKRGEEFVAFVKEVRQALRLRDLAMLEEVLEVAADIEYTGEDIDQCVKLRDDILDLSKRAAGIVKRLEVEEMKGIVAEAEKMEFVNEDILKMYDILKHKSDDKLLQLQLKAAIAEKDQDRISELTLKLKDKYFEKMGDMFTFSKFPKLKTASEFADGKLLALGKERDELVTRFLWHTTTPIHTSLTRDASSKEAKKMHLNILRAMGDRPTVKLIRDVVAKIQSKGIRHPELRDEIYCQLVKQLTFNENAASKEKGWRLLHLCLDTFPPGQDLENYLEMWIRKNASEPEITLHKLHSAMNGSLSPVLQTTSSSSGLQHNAPSSPNSKSGTAFSFNNSSSSAAAVDEELKLPDDAELMKSATLDEEDDFAADK